MIGLFSILCLWLVIGITVTVWFAYLAYRYYKKAKSYCKMQEDIVKKVEIRTKKEYNKIACLSPEDLSQYLTIIFSRALILKSDQEVSDKDPKAHISLYDSALVYTLEYLGEETLSAIDYYYGKDYVTRWCLSAYQALEIDNVASSIIKKERAIDSVVKQLSRWEYNKVGPG